MILNKKLMVSKNYDYFLKKSRFSGFKSSLNPIILRMKRCQVIHFTSNIILVYLYMNIRYQKKY